MKSVANRVGYAVAAIALAGAIGAAQENGSAAKDPRVGLKPGLKNAGQAVLNLEHVGSTSVPGLPAKPIIDMDLTVADPDDEPAYVPALTAVGFELRVREPWWFGHRVLRATEPRCHLHVFGYDSPEPIKHRIFCDWLRGNPADTARFFGVNAGTVPAHEFFAPDNVQRILGAARPHKPHQAPAALAAVA